jgi:hypothetical protein
LERKASGSIVTPSKPKGIAEALLAFQTNPPHIELDSTNPHFRSKFASLAGIMKALRPRLSKEGLVLSQPLTHIDGEPALCTILWHAQSGEKIEATTPLHLGGKTDPQSHGSAVTYARRYGVLAITGLVGDEDDDGAAASAASQPSSRADSRRVADATPPPSDDIEFAPDIPEVEPEQEAFPVPHDGITDKQLKFLRMLAEKLIKDEGHDFTVDAFRARLDAEYGVTSTKALTKKQATVEIEWLKAEAIEAGVIDG